MPIHVTCSACGKQYAAPDELAGQKTPCLVCGTPIPVLDGLMRTEPTQPAMPAPKPGQSKGSNRTLWIVLAVAGGLVLICGVCLFAGIYSLFSGTRDESSQTATNPANVSGSTNPQPAASTTSRPSRTTGNANEGDSARPASDRLPQLTPAPDNPQLITDMPIAVGRADTALLIDADPPLAYSLARDGMDYEIRVYSLRDGQQLKRAPVENARALFAGAPDGSRAAVSDSTYCTELKCVRLDDPSVVEAKWQPHVGKRLRWAEFVSPDQMLTCSIDGQLRMWKMPQSTQVYEAEITYGELLPRFTPDRRYLYDVSGCTVRFVDVTTGTYAAGVELEADEAETRLSYPTLANDGKTFWAFVNLPRAASRMFGCWDLQTRRRLFLTDMPADAGQPRRLTADYLLMGEYLFSMKHRKFIWKLPRFRPLAVMPNGVCWVRSNYNSELVLTTVKVPDDSLISKLEEQAGKTQTFAKLGDAVSLDVQMKVQPPSSDRDFPQKLTALLRQRLGEAGYKVADGQPRILRAVVTENDTGEEILFQKVAKSRSVGEIGTGETESVREIALVGSIDLIDQSGKSYYHVQRSRSPNHEYQTLELKLFQDLNALLMRRRWNGLLDQLKQSLHLNPEYMMFDMGESQVSVVLDPEWTAAQSAAARRRSQAEYDRRRTKIAMPDQRVRPPWNVQAFAVPDLDKVLLRRPLEIGKGRVHELKFTFPNIAQVAVRIESPSSGNQRSFLDRYDLRTRKRIARIPLAADNLLVDFRPDGKLLLLSSSRQLDKLQIWQCGEEDSMLAELDVSAKLRQVKQALFVGGNQLLTFDGRRISLWEFPSEKLVYERSLNTERCTLSWGRRYFVDIDQGRLGIYRTSDGQLAGELASPPMTAERIRCAAFRHDGKAIAVVTGKRHGNGGSIGIWSLDDGSLIQYFHAQHVKDSITWCSPRHLLVEEKLYDLMVEAPVWDYPQFLPDSPDSRGWFIGVDGQQAQHLAAVAVPSEDIAETIQKVLETAPAILRPQGAVSLELEISSSYPRPEETKRRLRETLTRKLTENKLRVIDGADTVLRVHWGGVSSGVNYTPFGFENGERIFTMPDRDMVVSVGISQRGKQAAWSKTASVYLPTVDYRVDWSVADPAADLQQQLEEALFKRLENLTTPAILLQDFRMTIGRSLVDLSGERTLVNGRFR